LVADQIGGQKKLHEFFAVLLATFWRPKLKKDGKRSQSFFCPSKGCKKDAKRLQSYFCPPNGQQPFLDGKRSSMQKGRQKVVALAFSFSILSSLV